MVSKEKWKGIIMNCENIITEEINKFLIQESFYAKHYDNEIIKTVKDIFKKFKNAMSNKVTSGIDFENGYVAVYVTMNKFYEIQGSYSDNFAPTIRLNIHDDTSFEEIVQLLQHELTHYFDDEKRKEVSYRSYKHQYSFMPDNMNDDLVDFLYLFWDTSEFNAWQSNMLNKGESFDIDYYPSMVKVLQELEQDNSAETWQPLKEYFIETLGGVRNAKGKIVQKWKDKPLSAVKNYFIKTTYKKLNKFRKKINRL